VQVGSEVEWNGEKHFPMHIGSETCARTWSSLCKNISGWSTTARTAALDAQGGLEIEPTANKASSSTINSFGTYPHKLLSTGRASLTSFLLTQS
jgi:hypothetical protein